MCRDARNVAIAARCCCSQASINIQAGSHTVVLTAAPRRENSSPAGHRSVRGEDVLREAHATFLESARRYKLDPVVRRDGDREREMVSSKALGNSKDEGRRGRMGRRERRLDRIPKSTINYRRNAL